MPAKEVCTLPKCRDYAKFIKESLAPNYTAIDPCEDFDKYSCDGWRVTHQYRPDQASLSVSTVMSDTIRDLLHAILDGPYSENTTFTGADKTLDVKNFNKMKTAYNTCTAEEEIKTYGVTPVRKILQEFESVFPIKGPAVSSNSSNEELTKVVTWLYKKNVAGLVSSSAAVSPKALPCFSASL